jgi:hypothetical protein
VVKDLCESVLARRHRVVGLRISRYKAAGEWP